MKYVKLVLGVLNLAAMTVLFLGLYPPAAPYLVWTAKVQFLPAVLALDAAVLAGLLALTLLFGRVYCEVLCPLGVFQDLVRLLRGNLTRRVCSRLPVTRVQRIVRYAILGALLAGIALSAVRLCDLPILPCLDPYGLFGRAVAWFRASEAGMAAAVYSLAGLALVGVLALVGRGRVWCNWACPVGTLLHLLSKRAWKKSQIRACDRCAQCKACWAQAKAPADADAQEKAS